MVSIKPGDRPDVIIMDISMGSDDEGIRTTSLIKSQFPDIQIIMFTVSDDDDRIFEAFKAGAMGYLLKDESPDFILNTIMEVQKGGVQMSPAIAKKAIQFMLTSRRPVPVHIKNDSEELTEREIEIVQLTADGLSYKEIAERLNISVNTVDQHIQKALRILRISVGGMLLVVLWMKIFD